MLNQEKSHVFQKADQIGALTSLEEKEALWSLGMEYIQNEGLAIEVGTWTGGSAVILGEVCKRKRARLICIDAFSSDMHSTGGGVHTDPFNTVLKNTQGLPIDFMAGDSGHFVNYLRRGIADFIFIDGDHQLPRVRTDIEGYYHALRDGGCYFMHDYGNPCDVKFVVDQYFFPIHMNRVDSSVYVIK